MSNDLQIIKELEKEIGYKLPIRTVGGILPNSIKEGGEGGEAYSEMGDNFCIGAFVDKKKVIGLAFAPEENRRIRNQMEDQSSLRRRTRKEEGKQLRKRRLEKIPSTLFKLKHLKKSTSLLIKSQTFQIKLHLYLT